MVNLLLGAGTFAVILGFVNEFLIKRMSFSYSTNIWLFCFLYGLSICVLVFLVPEMITYLTHWPGILIFTLSALLLIGFENFLSRALPAKAGFGYESVPDNYKSILNLDAKRAVTKIFEIWLQQVCALLILIGLKEFGLSVMAVSVIFTIVVFTLHIPTPKWFGKFYGNYFLWMSTIMAPLMPYLIFAFPAGFYLSISLHIFMYVVLYSITYLWRTK